jgi:hypothetical protein
MSVLHMHLLKTVLCLALSLLLLDLVLLELHDSQYKLLILAGDSREIEEVAKEWEHKLLQNSMDRELHELNKRLEQKEVVQHICIIRFFFFLKECIIRCISTLRTSENHIKIKINTTMTGISYMFHQPYLKKFI